jgi:hypothetical protein
MAIVIKFNIFWELVPTTNLHNIISQKTIILICYFVFMKIALKIEAVGLFRILVHIYQTTQWYISRRQVIYILRKEHISCAWWINIRANSENRIPFKVKSKYKMCAFTNVQLCPFMKTLLKEL